MSANFNEIIDDIKRRTKAGELPREVRIAVIDEAVEAWFRETGEIPDGKQLEKLADLILYEELTSTIKTKMQDLDYSFMSDRMEQTRKGGEASFKLSEERGVDGGNYKQPARRNLATHEAIYVDKRAKSRNTERKRSYNEFTKVQPVQTYHISELDA
jgi:hypothetical protein